MKKFTFSLLVVLALPLAMQAQRAVRWTVGVTTPIVSNAPTTFQYVGFSVKASYEKFKNQCIWPMSDKKIRTTAEGGVLELIFIS